MKSYCLLYFPLLLPTLFLLQKLSNTISEVYQLLSGSEHVAITNWNHRKNHKNDKLCGARRVRASAEESGRIGRDSGNDDAISTTFRRPLSPSTPPRNCASWPTSCCELACAKNQKEFEFRKSVLDRSMVLELCLDLWSTKNETLLT